MLIFTGRRIDQTHASRTTARLPTKRQSSSAPESYRLGQKGRQTRKSKVRLTCLQLGRSPASRYGK
jgi:hypothetical protein